MTLNDAPTDWGVVIGTVHDRLVPEHAPDQPSNTLPCAATAVSVITADDR